MRPNEPRHDGARDPRWAAPAIGMDLRRDDDAIHRDLLARFSRDPYLWWELDPDETSGWVYGTDSRILAKLVHVAPATEAA